MGMLTQARRAHPGAGWVRADARALPFAGAFDLAVSFGAAGHFLPAERPVLFASRRPASPARLVTLLTSQACWRWPARTVMSSSRNLAGSSRCGVWAEFSNHTSCLLGAVSES